MLALSVRPYSDTELTLLPTPTPCFMAGTIPGTTRKDFPPNLEETAGQKQHGRRSFKLLVEKKEKL